MLQNPMQMDGALGTGRAFGRSLKRDSQRRATYFEPLMRVSFRHQYYNRFDDACPDFGVRPTFFSQRLMYSLGLVFKDEETGFSIFYNKNRAHELESYLRRQGNKDLGPDEQFWTRLSFVLQSRSPYFANVTDIPIGIDPTAQNFYFSNQNAHEAPRESGEPDEKYILNLGQAVGPQQLLPVISSQYQVSVSRDVVGVVVRAISGEVVMCEPRCVPESMPLPPPGPGCSEWLVSLPPTPSNRCRDAIYLDFSLLPEDKYTVEYITDTGRVERTHKGLYTTEAPTPLCFIDLLFSKPTADAGGVYPVRDLASKGETTTTGVEYVLNFEARSTFWNYYIVPQPPEAEFDDLVIQSLAPHPTISFRGPLPVILVNGARAYQFVSEQPLRLRQQSTYRFRLHGRRRLDRRLDDDTLMDRLPVAANLQVLPRAIPTDRHIRHLRDRAGTTQRSTLRSRAGTDAGAQNYSDIYVYV